MSKCLNGIESIEFDSPVERQRFQVFLELYNELDLAYEAYLAEKVERDTVLAEELGKYTIPGFTPEQQYQTIAGITQALGTAIFEEIEKSDDAEAQVEKVFLEEYNAFRKKLTLAHKDGKVALTNEYLKIVRNWGMIEGMVLDNLRALGLRISRKKVTPTEEEAVVDVHTDANLELLEQVKQQLDEEERSEEGELVAEGEESIYERTKWDDAARFEIQAKDTATARLRLFMARVPEMMIGEDGKPAPRYGYLGMQRYVPFDTIWENTTAYLSEMDPDFEAYVGALQDSGNPNLQQLATLLSTADERIKAEFMTAMSKSYIDMLMVTWAPRWKGGKIIGYSMKLMRSNRHSVTDTIIQSWITNQQTSPLVTFQNGEMVIDQNTVKAIEERYTKRWETLRNLAQEGPMVELFQETLAAMGITMEKGQIYRFKGQIEKIMGGTWRYHLDPTEDKSFIRNLLDGFKPQELTGEETEGDDADRQDAEENYGLFGVNNPLIGTKGGRIQKLAKFVADNTDHLMTPSYRDIEKKQVHPYQDNHLLSTTIRKLRNGPEHAATMMQSTFSSRSLWGKELQESQTNRNRLSMQYMDGMRKRGSRRAQKRKNMSEAEQHLYALGLFQGAQHTRVGKDRVMASFVTPTHSDKTVSPIVSFIKRNIKVTIEEGKVVDLSEDTMDIMMNAVKAEAERIIYFQEHLEGNMGDQFEAYQKGAKKFFLSPWLNKDQMSPADAAVVWGPDGSLLMTDEAMAVMERLTKAAFIAEIQATVDQWHDQGVIVKGDDGEVTPLMNQQYLDRHAKYKATKDKIAYAAADYVLNYAVFYAEHFMLISGDPAIHFKKDVETTLDNIQKRLAKDIAPVLQGKWASDDTFRKVTIGDREIDSAERDAYHKLLGADFYKQITTTDAQEYTTLEEHIRVMRSYGRISEQVFNSILAKIEANRGGYFELTNEERDIILQPMKPLTVNVKHLDFIEVNGQQVPVHINNIVYTKSSSIPLVPELTKGLQIDKLRVAMENEKVDRAAHVSADKLGVSKSVKVYTGAGTVKDEIKFGREAIQILSRTGFGLQQELPVKKLEIATVSQMNKLLFEGIRSVSGFKFYSKEYTGKELESLKEDIRKRLFEAGDEALRRELGLVPNGDGSYRFTNLKTVQQVLLREAKNRGWSKADIESLALTKDGQSFIIPLAFSHASRQIESLLLSMIKRSITHQKVFGKGLVQASSAGFDSVGGATNIVWVKDHDPKQRLRHQRTGKNGEVLPAQIIVPWYFKGVNLKDYVIEDENGHKILDFEKLDPEVLKMIGARIPNQGHSSMGAFEIVGFTDPAYKSMAIVPDEIVAQMGSDFDIDKLYAYLSQYEIDKETGKISRLTLEKDPSNKMTVQQLKQVYADIHWAVLMHPEVMKKVMLPLERPDLKSEKQKIRDARGESGTLSPLFVRKQIADHIKNRAGKELVATFSLFSTAQSVLQEYNLRFDVDPMGTSISDAFVFGGKHFYKLSGNGVSYYNGEVRTKAQNIASLQSAAVDNAKENLLGFLNLNMITAPVAGLMAMLETDNGEALSLAYIARFLSQPAIVSAVDQISLMRSSLRTEWAEDSMAYAVDVTISKMFEELSGTTGASASGKSFSEGQLLEMIEKWAKRDTLTPEEQQELMADQVQVLEIFKALMGGAEDFGSFRKALLHADSNGAGKSMPQMRDQMEAWANLDSHGITFDQALYESEYYKAGEHALLNGHKYFSQLFAYSSPFFLKTKEILEDSVGLAFSPDDVQDLMSSARSLFYTQTTSFGDAAAERARLTVGENSLAKRVKAAKQTEWGSQNYFIQRLQPSISRTEGKPDFVNYQNSKAARLDEEEILRALSGMITSPDLAQRQLAYDLVAYAYLTGGRFGPTSYARHIPMAFLKYVKFDEQLRNMSMDDTILAHRFVEQYLQHNPTLAKDVRKNKEIMKRIRKGNQVLIHPDEIGIREVKAPDGGLVRAFYVSKARGASSLWMNRGEQADGSFLFEKVDLLGDSNFYEYDARAEVATSAFPDNKAVKAKPVPKETKKRVVNPPSRSKSNSNTDRTGNPNTIEIGFSQEVRHLTSIDYATQTGKERALYALDNVLSSKMQAIIPTLKASIGLLSDDFVFDIRDPLPGVAAEEWIIGQFRPDTNEVVMMQNRINSTALADKVVVHELIHAVTVAALKDMNNPLVRRLEEVMDGILESLSADPAFREAYNEMVRNMRLPYDQRRPMTNHERTVLYPLTNRYEFLAALFENPEFVESIKDVKIDGKSVLDTIIELLTNIISSVAKQMGVDIPVDSAVREAMALSLQVFPASDGPRDVSPEPEPDALDDFQYYGARYKIMLRRSGETVYPYDVVGYKGKADRKMQLLQAYMQNPDVDPQNGKQWRNAQPDEDVDEETEVQDFVDLSGSMRKTSFFAKDAAKAALANKMIGRGSERSSSQAYADAAGDKANVGSYSATDRVFITAEGNRAGRVAPDFEEIDRALAAGATIITDSKENRERAFNLGEREVAEHLAKKGYEEVGAGIWKPKTGKPAVTPTVKPEPAPPDTGDDTKYADLGNGRKANKQQRQALKKLDKFLSGEKRIFVLVGRGGTGKTTIIAKALEMAKGRDMAGAVISHAAANQLRNSIPETMTVASLLGIKLDEVEGTFRIDEWARKQYGIPIEKLDVIVIDETSMISKGIMEEMLKHMKPKAKIIFMGDNVQIPPISNDPADAIQSSTFDAARGEEFHKLTERMRSGENHPLVPISDLLAENIESKNPELRAIKMMHRKTKVDKDGNGIIFESDVDKVIEAYLADLARMGESADPLRWARIVTFNNHNHPNAQSVMSLNTLIRERIYGEQAAKARFIPGEIITTYAPYNGEQVGDSPKYGQTENTVSFKVVSLSEPRPLRINEHIMYRGERFSAVGSVMMQELTVEDEKGKTQIFPVVATGYESEYKKFVADAMGTGERRAPGGLFYKISAHFLDAQPAYAITAHKAQGQTFTNVVVMEDNILGQSNGNSIRAKNQILYTAITRASHKVTIHSVVNKGETHSYKPTKREQTDLPDRPSVGESLADSTPPNMQDLKEESPFLMPASLDFGITIDVVMRQMTKEQRELFRKLRNEGFITTKCQ